MINLKNNGHVDPYKKVSSWFQIMHQNSRADFTITPASRMFSSMCKDHSLQSWHLKLQAVLSLFIYGSVHIFNYANSLILSLKPVSLCKHLQHNPYLDFCLLIIHIQYFWFSLFSFLQNFFFLQSSVILCHSIVLFY